MAAEAEAAVVEESGSGAEETVSTGGTPTLPSPDGRGNSESGSESSPATSGAYDYDEVEKRAYAATQRAIADAQKAAAQAQAQAQPTQRAYNPEVDAVDALDMREDLLEEAIEMVGDLPAEARRELRTQLRQFKTVEALQGVKASGLHKTLADAAYGKAVREGKHAPANHAGGVTREPVHSEPMPKVPTAFRQEMAELEGVLGVKFSEAEIAKAWAER